MNFYHQSMTNPVAAIEIEQDRSEASGHMQRRNCRARFGALHTRRRLSDRRQRRREAGQLAVTSCRGRREVPLGACPVSPFPLSQGEIHI